MTVRRAAAAFLFLSFVYGSVEWPLIGKALDRDLARNLDVYVEPLGPDYPRFLDGVLARTRRGDTIALVTPAPNFYGYPYQRTVYGLPGRDVLPILSPANVRMPENVARADYVIVWDVPALPAGRGVLWRFSERGVLLGR